MIPHAYGPHRDEDAPRVVTILTSNPAHREQTVPYPAELLAQRRALNSIAHDRANRSREDNRADER